MEKRGEWQDSRRALSTWEGGSWCGDLSSLGRDEMTGSAPVGPDERRCPFCRAAVPVSADVCPQCGRILREHFPVVASVTATPTETFTPPHQKIAHHARRRLVWPGIAVAMVLIVSAVVFGLVPVSY